MSSTPKVSILIPVYNAERYLEQCLNSIIEQTLRDIEILVINDGSTDNSLDIIKKIAKNDKRIIVIDKINEGYGKTLNLGIKLSRGKYIGFIDSDDFVDKQMFETLYFLAEKNSCEVVKSCWFNYRNGIDEIISFVPDDKYDKVLNPKYDSSVFYSQNSVWSAIYKNEFLRKNNILFLETPGASFQDVSFSYKVWFTAKYVYFTRQAYVHYRIGHEQSVSSKGKVFCICDEIKEINRFSERSIFANESYTLRCHLLLNNYLWNINRLDGENKELFRKVFYRDFNRIKGEVDKKCFTFKQWLKICLIAEPDNFWYKFLLFGLDIIRLFYKERIRKQKKSYIIFSFITLKVVACKFPNILNVAVTHNDPYRKSET